MPRGPIPDPKSRRRNAPTIPTTALPASGRKGKAPSCPARYRLNKAGREWWTAAWKTPQSVSWDAGSMDTVARRASLQDDLAALDLASKFSFEDLLAAAVTGSIDPEDLANLGRSIDFIIGHLKSMAGGRLGILKEMRELERQLGLGPKALADLRWEIIDDSNAEGLDAMSTTTAKGKKKGAKEKRGSAQVSSPADRRARLSVVGG